MSIYVGERYKGQGIGTALLTNLIRLSEEIGIWTLYCAVIRENNVSIVTHKKFGFREIGIGEKVAKTADGIWLDVVLLEPKSKVVGVD